MTGQRGTRAAASAMSGMERRCPDGARRRTRHTTRQQPQPVETRRPWMLLSTSRCKICRGSYDDTRKPAAAVTLSAGLSNCSKSARRLMPHRSIWPRPRLQLLEHRIRRSRCRSRRDDARLAAAALSAGHDSISHQGLQRELCGQIIVRHMWATGELSNPRPSFGCLT
jgi:hypothetical protein